MTPHSFTPRQDRFIRSYLWLVRFWGIPLMLLFGVVVLRWGASKPTLVAFGLVVLLYWGQALRQLGASTGRATRQAHEFLSRFPECPIVEHELSEYVAPSAIAEVEARSGATNSKYARILGFAARSQGPDRRTVPLRFKCLEGVPLSS